MMRKINWLRGLLAFVSMTFFCSAGLADSTKRDFNDGQVGIASYFSDKYHGRKTASGELYDKNDLTTAHATLPFGTLLHVVNLQNNRSVDVRVISRAHPANKRLLDLSKRAAKELGFLRSGITKVKVTILRLGDA